jgi:arylformamidase
MLTEISYVLNNKIPKWPTNPSEELIYIQDRKNNDPCQATSVYHHMHNGTHVDAPRHFSENGLYIHELPIDQFFYTSPLVISLNKSKGDLVEVCDLEKHFNDISKADILCAYTGYSDFRNEAPEEFVDNFPAFSGEAANYLRENFPKLKALALDVLSVDSPTLGPKNNFPAHRALLDYKNSKNQNPIVIYEDVNLCKLAKIKDPVKFICAFPIRWEFAEAGPVNMVAIT